MTLPTPDPNSTKAAQKKKRDLVITAVLLVIFAFSFTKNVLFYKFNPKEEAATAASDSADGSQSMSDQLVYVTNLRQYDKIRDDQRKIWNQEWGRDPFVQPAVASRIVKAVNLTLSGVFWDDKNPKAIVNEKALFTGDTIYGYTVVEIRPRSVILRTGEKNIELTIFRPVISEIV